MSWVVSVGAIAAIALSASCTDVVNEPAPSPDGKLSEAVFTCNVEPILVRECSYTACHGNAGFPLRVYSQGKLRAMAPKNIDEAIAALTAAEHHANFLSATGFAFGGIAPDDNLLLRKTLPSSDGGFEHAGGPVFAGPHDPGYVAIHDWLAGKGVCK
jgi:hypothetical protein